LGLLFDDSILRKKWFFVWADHVPCFSTWSVL
jgi:hypothetical protein